MSEKGISSEQIKDVVRQTYALVAQGPCCGVTQETSCCGSTQTAVPWGKRLAKAVGYSTEVDAMPESVTESFAGCGNPVALAGLKEGETVLDLGSGGGIDCFLAAQKVGETGKVIGVDMTPQMLDRARANKEKIGAQNVEFRMGEIEHLPAADGSVDVIMSNCVINLSPDKSAVFREAFRVLKPGGRFAVTDIVTDGPLPETISENLAAWYGCVAGALDYRDFSTGLEAAGFVDVQVSPVELDLAEITAGLEKSGIEVSATESGEKKKAFVIVDGEPQELDLGDSNPPFSARITARKPPA